MGGGVDAGVLECANLLALCGDGDLSPVVGDPTARTRHRQQVVLLQSANKLAHSTWRAPLRGNFEERGDWGRTAIWCNLVQFGAILSVGSLRYTGAAWLILRVGCGQQEAPLGWEQA